jgi:hypothetical protein
MACFRKSLEVYEKAGKYFEPPLERIEVAFGAKVIPIYLRVARNGQRHSIVINFGGIDSFKAESYEYDEGLQNAGMASCSWICLESASVRSKRHRPLTRSSVR